MAWGVSWGGGEVPVRRVSRQYRVVGQSGGGRGRRGMAGSRMSTSTSRMQSGMSTTASRLQSRMSTSRLQYLTDEEEEEEVEEERSFKPKVAIEISKKRYLLNRPISFNDQPAVVMEEVRPVRELLRQYVRSSTTSRGVQAAAPKARAEVNTPRTSVTSVGIEHTEGCWPREVDHKDPDQTSRYRKNVEREEEFIDVTRGLVDQAEKAVRQNVTVDIYEEYFPEVDHATSWPECSVKTVAVFKDRVEGEGRAVMAASWALGDDRVALAYCNPDFLAEHPAHALSCPVYSVEDPSRPVVELEPEEALARVEWSPRHPGLVAGGGLGGILHCWDIRQGGAPQVTAATPGGEMVTGLAWLGSKHGTELLATRADGSILKWDIRQPGEVVTQTWLPRPGGGEAWPGAACLDYQQATPHRLLVGSDLGTIYSVSARARPGAGMVLAEYGTRHHGAVRAVHRNPTMPKLFLTVGSWCSRVWSEEVRHSSILRTGDAGEQLTAGCWSPSRSSVFLTGRGDGVVEVWDLHYSHTSPAATSWVSNLPVTALRHSERGGMVVAGSGGVASLLQLSEGLVACSREERVAIAAMYERETRRERVLGGMEKEGRTRQVQVGHKKQEQERVETEEREEGMKRAERKFFDIIKKERETRVAELSNLLSTSEKDL